MFALKVCQLVRSISPLTSRWPIPVVTPTTSSLRPNLTKSSRSILVPGDPTVFRQLRSFRTSNNNSAPSNTLAFIGFQRKKLLDGPLMGNQLHCITQNLVCQTARPRHNPNRSTRLLVTLGTSQSLTHMPLSRAFHVPISAPLEACLFSSSHQSWSALSSSGIFAGTDLGSTLLSFLCDLVAPLIPNTHTQPTHFTSWLEFAWPFRKHHEKQSPFQMSNSQNSADLFTNVKTLRSPSGDKQLQSDTPHTVDTPSDTENSDGNNSESSVTSENKPDQQTAESTTDSISDNSPVTTKTQPLTLSQRMWAAWWLLKDLLKGELFVFAVGIMGVMHSTFLSSMSPRFFGRVLDSFSGSPAQFQIAIAKAVGIIVCQLVVTFIYQTAIAMATERIGLKLKQKIFWALLHKDMEYFDSKTVSDALSFMSSDIDKVHHSIKHLITNGCKGIGQLLGGVTSLFLISPKLTGILSLTLPVLVGAGRVYVTILQKISETAGKVNLASLAVARESLTNLASVRSSIAEEAQHNLYTERAQENYWLSRKFQLGVGLFHSMSILATQAVSFGVLLYGATLVKSGFLTAGDITSYMISALSLQNSLAQLSQLHTEFLEGSNALMRVQSVLEYEDKIENSSGALLVDAPKAFEFKNVSFAYPCRPEIVVLDGINLRLEAGKFYALVGGSGSGKTTLTKLLQRFYDPTEGQILVDGTPLSTLQAKSYRQHIATVPQEPLLFNISLYENIRFSSPFKTKDDFNKVIRAAQKASIHSTILALPHGYHTKPGEFGKTLSTGQKMRVCIARLLYRCERDTFDHQHQHGGLVILDEATAALDAKSEEKVWNQVLETVRDSGACLVVVAHRLGTVREADQIVVMHNGKVVEVGSHPELRKRAGEYENLWKLQNKE